MRFSILLDEEEDVSLELYTSKSPWIFVVDRRGTVVREGTMDEVNVCDALAVADEEGAPALPPTPPRSD